MKADREDLGVRLEDVLHAIAVVHIDVHVGDAMALVLEPPARDGGIVVSAEPRRTLAMGVVKTARRAERVQRGAAFDRLRGDEGRAGHERSPLVELNRDRVVRRPEACLVDLFGRDEVALLGVAQLAHELDVAPGMNELQLLDRRPAGRQQVGVLDETGRADEVHRQLHPNRLQWMLVRQVVLHELVPIDERDRSRHVHLP